ncbi:hypothetical protein [Bacillus sp. MRMR6]|uniref:hypothetical protein n=1 Tax=Bacillus sp. MRMR6 TaxID=1928617 RepID=UPI0009519CCB|nr:hypothetical protein [Bacillus sp. MRMR6]OLS39110.1 hypothetical protein BTR25_13330 [Bacillus sp. MRMR6]
MKLGDKVTTFKILVKSNEYLPDNPDLMTPEQKQKWEDGDPIWVKKRVIKKFEKAKEGIVVGKRKISVANLLDWVEGDFYLGEYAPDGRYRSIETTFENVYLVACNLKGLYYVRPEDVEGSENHV